MKINTQSQIWYLICVYYIRNFVFCSWVFFGKVTNEDTKLQEAFLNVNSSVNTGKFEGSPYLNAGLFSKLCFTWIGSLISIGYKKTLDLDDVPPLSGMDDANESYMVFRNFLGSSRMVSNKRVTTFKRMKSLFFITWVDIVLTGFLCFLYGLAMFVGPYLIDTFVQYLNGRRVFDNEGIYLVCTFFIAN